MSRRRSTERGVGAGKPRRRFLSWDVMGFTCALNGTWTVKVGGCPLPGNVNHRDRMPQGWRRARDDADGVGQGSKPALTGRDTGGLSGVGSRYSCLNL